MRAIGEKENCVVVDWDVPFRKMTRLFAKEEAAARTLRCSGGNEGMNGRRKYAQTEYIKKKRVVFI